MTSTLQREANSGRRPRSRSQLIRSRDDDSTKVCPRRPQGTPRRGQLPSDGSLSTDGRRAASICPRHTCARRTAGSVGRRGMMPPMSPASGMSGGGMKPPSMPPCRCRPCQALRACPRPRPRQPAYRRPPQRPKICRRDSPKVSPRAQPIRCRRPFLKPQRPPPAATNVTPASASGSAPPPAAPSSSRRRPHCRRPLRPHPRALLDR